MHEEIAQSVDTVTASQRAWRVQQDAEQVELLRQNGFNGPEYDVFADRLCLASMPILRGLLRSGRLIRLSQERFASRGIPFWVHEDDVDLLHSSRDDRDEIIIDVLVAALRAFHRNALVRGRWNPEYKGVRGPCCLTTFFIGQCAWDFRKAYVAWAGRRARLAKQQAELCGDEALLRLLRSPGYLPESEVAVLGDSIAEILAQQPEATRAVVLLTAEGYSASEIAEKLSVSRGAVSMRLTRFRSALYQAARERRIWIPEQLHAGNSRGRRAERGVA